MGADPRSVIVVSASSDIGMAISEHWLGRGWRVFGTYRTRSQAIERLERAGARLVSCDLSQAPSVHEACAQLRTLCPRWDVLVLCPGTQEPVGPFVNCSFDEWEESVRVNFTGQIRIIHELLPSRRVNPVLEPLALLFAGGGTNTATLNYSAYTISKIALIKMCELLDAEVPDTRFAILGPGWVKTKIHEATLQAKGRAGANYQRTIYKLAGEECTPMEQVIACCEWLVDAPRAMISGRNFSLVFDLWGKEALAERLLQDPNLYKLRRYGNDWLVRDGAHR